MRSKDCEMVGWGNKESQEIRFDVLSEVSDFTNKSVLDVGCGLGAFYAHLKNQGMVFSYIGVDINSRMIAKAKERYPSADFRVQDILTHADPLPLYDFVILSGAFNLSQNRHKDIVAEMIRMMYKMSRVAIAFNMLSVKADFFEPGEYYARPGEMLDFCLTMTQRVILRHDYMTHDFTVYMYHDE